MDTIEYRDTIDRTGWPSGPWDDEPDKIQYPDEATGLPCLIRRNRMGALCGYVGVAEGHAFFGYDPANKVDVHGGVNFTDFCMDEDDPAHAICHIPGPGEPDRVWWIGYDCAHGGIDAMPGLMALDAEFDGRLLPLLPGEGYKTVEYVRAMNAHLAAQLAALA